MRFILIVISVLTTVSLAHANEDYNSCIENGYYTQNRGPKSCDFSKMDVDMGSVYRTCNMALVQPGTDMKQLIVQLQQLEKTSLEKLNSKLNSRLRECGYFGEIIYGRQGASIEIYHDDTNNSFEAESRIGY
jgi:hypothetical protein